MRNTEDNTKGARSSFNELGFVPAVIDGKRHKLKVVLTKEAKEKYRGVQLRFRSEYIPAAVPEWAR